MLLAVGLVFGGLFAWQLNKNAKKMAAMATMARPPATVSTALATETQWQQSIHAVGTVTPIEGIHIAPEVAGTISAIHFISGQQVKKGDILIELENSIEQATLENAQAQATLGKLMYDRVSELRSLKVNTQAEFDKSQAEYDQAMAAVKIANATLAKKMIRAPFDGILGLKNISMGEYIHAGAEIVSLQSIAPIYVDFSLPQHQYYKVKQEYTVIVTAEGLPDETFTGSLLSISPNLEESTRSVRARAEFKNIDQKLVPGMFVRVSVKLPQADHVVILPATAISFNPYGNAVYIVKPGDAGAPPTVQQRFIKTGQTMGDMIEILEGIQAGEEVVTTGQLKIRNGVPIQIKNDRIPSAEENPTPDES